MQWQVPSHLPAIPTPTRLAVAFSQLTLPPDYRRRPSLRLPGMPHTNPLLLSRIFPLCTPACDLYAEIHVPNTRCQFYINVARHLWSLCRWSNLHVSLPRSVYARWCVRSLAMLSARTGPCIPWLQPLGIAGYLECEEIHHLLLVFVWLDSIPLLLHTYSPSRELTSHLGHWPSISQANPGICKLIMKAVFQN